MTFEQFHKSVSAASPPDSLSGYLRALWFDAKGDWEKAHTIIQDIHDNNAAWIHAYLHRKEGEIWNADYWYSRAGRTRPSFSLEEEWKDITEEMVELSSR